MAVFQNITIYKSNANNLAIATTNSGGGTPTEQIGVTTITTGTITTTSGNTAVVGVGTLFTSEVSVGSYLFTTANPPVYIGKVATVTNNTNLVLESGGAYVSLAGVAYVKTQLNDGLSTSQDILMRVPVLVVDSVTRTIPKVSFLRNPNGALVSSYTDTTYIQFTQTSTSNLPGTSIAPVNVPVTVERLNIFTQASLPTGSYFPTSGDLPTYIWYKINPYGNTGSLLNVYTRLNMFIQETLPDINITTNMLFATINNGDY